MPRTIGYARVSTEGQTLETQVSILKKQGCNKVFKEKISGAKTSRPELTKLLSYIKEDDTVMVTRIDRMARSTFDLFSIVSQLSSQRVIFYSLAEPWADTTTSTGRLMLAILGGLADVERDLIRIRTTEGRARAIEQGVKMGRPCRILGTQRSKMVQQRASGKTLHAIASYHGVAPSTVCVFLSRKSKKRALSINVGSKPSIHTETYS